VGSGSGQWGADPAIRTQLSLLGEARQRILVTHAAPRTSTPRRRCRQATASPLASPATRSSSRPPESTSPVQVDEPEGVFELGVLELGEQDLGQDDAARADGAGEADAWVPPSRGERMFSRLLRSRATTPSGAPATTRSAARRSPAAAGPGDHPIEPSRERTAPRRPMLRSSLARLGSASCLAVDATDCAEEFLVAAFLVACGGVFLRASPYSDHLVGLDDEEEDGGRDRDERDQGGDEGAVIEE